MTISNSIKTKLLIFASFLLLSPSLHSATESVEPAAPSAEEIKAAQDAMDQLLRQHIDHTKAIDRALEDILLLATNNALKVTNKKEFLENTKALKDMVASLANEGFVQIDIGTLQMVHFLNKAVMEHIIQALDNYLVEFPVLNLEQAMTRHRPRVEVTYEDLLNDINSNNELLATLSTKATTAGLRWHNKAYRKVDNWVIQPSLNWDLPRRGLLALGASFLAMQTIFRLDYTYEGIPVLEWLRKKLGPAPQFSGGGLNTAYHALPGNELKGWGKVNKFFVEMSSGHATIDLFVWAGLSAYLILEREKIKKYITDKASQLHNYLKGGTYAEKPTNKFAINPKVTFKDLVGLKDAKATLSFIVEYMENPERYDRAKLTPEKGYLLTGPTRTGKSYLAEALAGEIKQMFIRTNRNPDDFNFFVLSASFILSDGIDAIIERAKKYAPCILFIDEIDLLCLQRAGGHSELLSKFLSAMNGCLESDPEKVVIIIAATNQPQHLDKALRQPGRFGKEIRFEYPGFNDRKELLERRIGALANINLFDIDMLARETEGKSFEAINAMVKRAFQKGIVRGETLTQATLEECFDEEIRNIIAQPGSEPSQPEKQLIAAHQAGQALAVMLLNNKEILSKVTIKPYLTQLYEEAAWEQYKNPNQDKTEQKKIQYGKFYTHHAHDIKDIHSLADKIAQCKIQLAGFAAEEIVLGSCGYSYHQEDAMVAFEIAKSIASEGINLAQLPTPLQATYITKALELKQQCAQEIKELLVKHKDKLKLLANALLEKQTLTGEEAARIVGLPYKGITKKTSMKEAGIPEVTAS